MISVTENPKRKYFLRMIIASCIMFIFTTFLFSNIVMVYSSRNGLLDFGSFIASGQEATANRNPYTANTPLIFWPVFTKLNIGGPAPNLNPPISVLIFQSIANLDPIKSVTVWRIFSILLYLLSLAILIRNYPEKSTIPMVAWAISLAGFWHTLQLGQIYVPLLFATITVWIFIEKEHFILAGLALGILIATKPNFAFWALLLGFAGYWSTLFTAGGTAFMISLIPLIIYGPNIYYQWLDAAAFFTPSVLLWPGNNSLQGLGARFGLADMGTILSILLVILASIYIYKIKPPASQINILGIVVSLLISPIAWTGYTILTLPIFFARRQWSWQYWIAALIFIFPFMFILPLFQISSFGFLFFGWFYGWGLLFILADLFFPTIKLVDNIAR